MKQYWGVSISDIKFIMALHPLVHDIDNSGRNILSIEQIVIFDSKITIPKDCKVLLYPTGDISYSHVVYTVDKYKQYKLPKKIILINESHLNIESTRSNEYEYVRNSIERYLSSYEEDDICESSSRTDNSDNGKIHKPSKRTKGHTDKHDSKIHKNEGRKSKRGRPAENQKRDKLDNAPRKSNNSKSHRKDTIKKVSKSDTGTKQKIKSKRKATKRNTNNSRK